MLTSLAHWIQPHTACIYRCTAGAHASSARSEEGRSQPGQAGDTVRTWSGANRRPFCLYASITSQPGSRAVPSASDVPYEPSLPCARVAALHGHVREHARAACHSRHLVDADTHTWTKPSPCAQASANNAWHNPHAQQAQAMHGHNLDVHKRTRACVCGVGFFVGSELPQQVQAALGHSLDARL